MEWYRSYDTCAMKGRRPPTGSENLSNTQDEPKLWGKATNSLRWASESSQFKYISVLSHRHRNIDKNGYKIPYRGLIDGNRFGVFQADMKEGKTQVSTSDGLLSYLREANIQVQYAEVRDYLTRHSDMAEVIEVAIYKALDRFHDRATLSLEVYSDPDDDDDEHLVLYVRQRCYEPTIMDEIRDTRAAYAALLSDKTGWLHMTTDFQPVGCDERDNELEGLL